MYYNLTPNSYIATYCTASSIISISLPVCYESVHVHVVSKYMCTCMYMLFPSTCVHGLCTLVYMCFQVTVCFSLFTVAPQLKIAENRLTVTGDKGYCMVRATHGKSRVCQCVPVASYAH